ncbi:MAG: flagellar biosynthetic protein FliQ [Bacillota bacterium]|jgi:flagellar biosynthetic protein FliQ
MLQGDLLTIAREAVITGLMVSAPFLIISLVIGLIVSVLQAATQIHEQSIVFVPKIIATGLIILFLGSWIINIMLNFTQNIFVFMNSLF